MKNILANSLLFVALVFLSCNNNDNKEKPYKTLDMEWVKKQCLTNNTSYKLYSSVFNSVDENMMLNGANTLKQLDSSFFNMWLNKLPVTINGSQAEMEYGADKKYYFYDFHESENYYVFSFIEEYLIGNCLYLVSVTKNADAAIKIFYIGDGSYDEFYFMTYLEGEKVNENTFRFSQVSKTFTTDDGASFRTTEADSIVFNCSFTAGGEMERTKADTIKIINP